MGYRRCPTAQLGFSDTVVFLTAQHVAAKRYLCAREPGYLEALSAASRTTLEHQGGPMSERECAQAEAVSSAEGEREREASGYVGVGLGLLPSRRLSDDMSCLYPSHRRVRLLCRP